MSESGPVPGGSSSFRDSIPTVDQKGKRVWMYPRRPPTGKQASPDAQNFYQLRTYVSWFLLLVLFTGSFIRINGNPLLMMNIVERKFSVFGVKFYTEDFYLFALAFITGMIMLVLFTAVFGRVFCGWVCPQTVLMEMVFRKIEYAIEGDAAQQRKLNDGPWTPNKITKKFSKNAIFFALSFVIANFLLAYIVGSERVLQIISAPPSQNAKGLVAMLLFTLVFYGIFSRFREQACTFICPYGRLQSVLLDENSIVVAYDHKRGENRARKTRSQTPLEREDLGLGDCVDCKLCIQVCPTGIDIRNGTQMECVNCCNCIDACNSVMKKVGFEPGLIRFASLNNIEKNQTFRFTPRIIGYCLILIVLLTALTVVFAGYDTLDTSFTRTKGQTFDERSDGSISNIYDLKISNKSNEQPTVTFAVELAGAQIHTRFLAPTIGPQEDFRQKVRIDIPANALDARITPLTLVVFENGEEIERIETKFNGPTQ